MATLPKSFVPDKPVAPEPAQAPVAPAPIVSTPTSTPQVQAQVEPEIAPPSVGTEEAGKERPSSTIRTEQGNGRSEAAVDAGTTGKGPDVHGSGAPGARPGAGEETEVLVPGESRAINARYEVRELADIQPSHHGETFSPNPSYALKNERDYSKPENQQRVIDNSSDELFNPRYHVTDNPDATNGPVVIDERGNALGGNSRSMILQRVYGRGAKASEAYRALLEKKAENLLVDELLAGRPGRAFRTLLLLATVFPIAGEVISDLRTWMKGGERKTSGIKRWLEDIGQAGSLGVIYDMLDAGSWGKGTDFVGGPTAGEAGQLIDIAGGPNKQRNAEKWIVKHVPFLGPLFYSRIFPPPPPAQSPAMKKLQPKSLKPKKSKRGW